MPKPSMSKSTAVLLVVFVVATVLYVVFADGYR